MQNYISEWIDKLNNNLNSENTEQIIKLLDNNTYPILKQIRKSI